MQKYHLSCISFIHGSSSFHWPNWVCFPRFYHRLWNFCMHPSGWPYWGGHHNLPHWSVDSAQDPGYMFPNWLFATLLLWLGSDCCWGPSNTVAILIVCHHLRQTRHTQHRYWPGLNRQVVFKLLLTTWLACEMGHIREDPRTQLSHHHLAGVVEGTLNALKM